MNNKNNQNDDKKKGNEKLPPLKDNKSERKENDSSDRNQVYSSTKPWVSYAMAVCNGLQNQINNAEDKVSSSKSGNSNNKNTVKKLKSNQMNIMNKVFKELNDLTKKTQPIERTYLKPYEIKKLVKTSDDKKSHNENPVNKKLSKENFKENRTDDEKISSNEPSFNLDNYKGDPEEEINEDQKLNQNNLVSELLSNIVHNEFKCSICQELVINATNLQCSHIFCKVCIDEWLGKNKQCPVCRKKISNCNDSRYHVLPIDNFLNHYFQNFTNNEQQSDRSKLINDHHLSNVTLLNNNANSQSNQRGTNQHNPLDIFNELTFEIQEFPRIRRGRRGRRRRNRLRTGRVDLSGLNQLNTPNNLERLNNTESEIINNRMIIAQATNSRSQNTQTEPISEILISSDITESDTTESSGSSPVLIFEIDMIDLSENPQTNEQNIRCNRSTRQRTSRRASRRQVLRNRLATESPVVTRRPLRNRSERVSIAGRSRSRIRASNRTSSRRRGRSRRRVVNLDSSEHRHEERRRTRRLRRSNINDFLLDRQG